MTTVTFRSRIDSWLLAVVALPLAYALWRVITQFAQHRPSALVPLVVVVLSSLLVVWLFSDTYYTVTPSDLLMHGGPMRVRIPLANIRRIRRSNSVLAAPALSLRRLQIDHGGGMALISPKDEAAFLALIRERVPGVVLPAS